MSASKEPPEPFSRPRGAPRTRMLTVRITEGQDALLNTIKEELGIDRAEAVRLALDFWVSSGPHADALRGLKGKTEGR